jgi:uncharacterized membrane protein YfcA
VSSRCRYLLGVFKLTAPDAVALSVIGSLGYLLSVGTKQYFTGGIGWPMVATLMAGSLVGGVVGAMLVTIVPEHVIRLIVALSTIGVGIMLLRSVWA